MTYKRKVVNLLKMTEPKKQRQLYADGQALNQKLRAEQIEYENFKTQFGDTMPYKTLGAFRRAKRSDSETYKDLKQLVTQ